MGHNRVHGHRYITLLPVFIYYALGCVEAHFLNSIDQSFLRDTTNVRGSIMLHRRFAHLFLETIHASLQAHCEVYESMLWEVNCI